MSDPEAHRSAALRQQEMRSAAGHPVIITAPWLTSPATQRVFAMLERGGFDARAVGGIVRNTLLGLPATDIDIATNATPAEVMRLATSANLKMIPTGLAHGTVTVLSEGTSYEVTTLRRDVVTDGRHAEVVFTTDWAADAARRDFTINALYCDARGEIFDPLGGLADLSPLKIRFIGDPQARIAEDYLRILRFFRFAAIYTHDGALDADGLAACTALRDGLERISGERIAAELMKLLTAHHAVAVTRSLVQSGVFQAIFPNRPDLDGLAKLARIEHQLGRTPDAVLRLAALAVHSPNDARLLDQRLHLSAHDRDRLVACPSNAHEIALACSPEQQAEIDLEMDQRATRAAVYHMGPERFRDAILLAWTRSNREPFDSTLASHAAVADLWPRPVFPVSGRDAVAVAMTPGPAIGKALAALEADWIASDFKLARGALIERLRQIAVG